jgi:hypothetical protein
LLSVKGPVEKQPMLNWYPFKNIFEIKKNKKKKNTETVDLTD